MGMRRSPLGGNRQGYRDKQNEANTLKSKTHLFCAEEYIRSVFIASYEKTYMVHPPCQSIMGNPKYVAKWIDEALVLSALPDDDW